MAFFKRLFSTEYRRGVAAEAAGDYLEAARAYALAGDRTKVAEMHLERAQRCLSLEERLHELETALRWADAGDEAARLARGRVARSLFEWARTRAVPGDAELKIARRAAVLFTEVGDHGGAGECYELIGDELAAADAYQRAGEVERLEAVLEREERRRGGARRLDEAFAEYRLELARGEPELAAAALRTCIAAAEPPSQAWRDRATESENPASAPDRRQVDYRRMLAALEERILDSSLVTFRTAGGTVRYVGGFPLIFGREGRCAVVLRDGGISRRHAEVALADGHFLLRDLDSRNGTRLGGVAIAGTVPLAGAGQLGVGDHCDISFEATGDLLTLKVVRGIDRGLVVMASTAPLAIAGVAELTFSSGRPRLEARPGHRLSLNGVQTGHAVKLCRGDAVQIGAQLIEVV